MDGKSKSSGTHRLPDPTDPPALWQSAFKQSEDWMRPGFAALEDVQATSQRWMTHRLEDFQKAVDATRRMAECRDFAQAAAIQQEWLAECTQRLVADWTALLSPAAKQGSQHGEGTKKAAE
jgi:hypothetical protein